MPDMVVTLDVSRLSGWLNADADCRVERRAYEAGLGEAWVRKHEVLCKTAAPLAACREAHPKHVVHGCDAGCVETQRLVERTRPLPNQEEGMRGGVRPRPGGARAERRRRRRKRCAVGKGRLEASRARAKRTANMLLMSVTLDVSKLSGWLNAVAPSPVSDPPNMKLMSVTPEVFQLSKFSLKLSKPEKSPLMSVMYETSQSAMGP